MRTIGIDVHRDFCEVAISEGGELRSAGPVPSTPHDLELLAASLAEDDEVALEATGNALASPWPPSAPTGVSSPIARPAGQRRRARAPHWGAHLRWALEGPCSAAGSMSPYGLPFSSRSPAPATTIAQRGGTVEST